MNKLILTALCALALGSVASASSTVIYHDYGQVLGVGAEGIALNNACVTATTVQSIAPVEVCTKLVAIEHPAQGEFGGYTEWVCEAKATRKLVAQRAFEREVCTSYSMGETYECLAKEKKADFLPNTINIRTVTLSNDEAGSNEPGVSSTFTFPDCN